jgi:hypothetical protein
MQATACSDEAGPPGRSSCRVLQKSFLGASPGRLQKQHRSLDIRCIGFCRSSSLLVDSVLFFPFVRCWAGNNSFNQTCLCRERRIRPRRRDTGGSLALATDFKALIDRFVCHLFWNGYISRGPGPSRVVIVYEDSFFGRESHHKAGERLESADPSTASPILRTRHLNRPRPNRHEQTHKPERSRNSGRYRK